MMLEQKLIEGFKQYLDSIGKSYDDGSSLKELVNIVLKCNPSGPSGAVGAIFRHVLFNEQDII